MGDKVPEVEIRTISYAPVARTRTDDDYWNEVLQADELSAEIRARFIGYFNRVYKGREANVEEVRFDGRNGRTIKKQLEKLSKTSLNSDARGDITQELADGLCSEMKDRPTAKSGALFVVDALVNKQAHGLLVKVEFRQRHIIALKEAAEDHRLLEQFFQRAIPEQERAIQKAVLMPSPGEGQARTLQVDSQSEYWLEFIGTRPVRAPKQATKKVQKIIEEIFEKETKGDVAFDTFDRAIQALQKTPDPRPESVAKIIRKHTGAKKSEKEIAKLVAAKVGKSKLEEFAPLTKSVYTFSHGLRFHVPSALLRSEKVTVTREGEDVVIRIKQSTLIEKHVAE